MRTRRVGRIGVLVLAGLAVVTASCGRSTVVGIGNSANRIVENGLLEEVAAALVRQPSIPPVTDEQLVEVFDAIVARADDGDPEAALIVFLVAEEQRKPPEK